jgi:hypothetical protein
MTAKQFLDHAITYMPFWVFAFASLSVIGTMFFFRQVPKAAREDEHGKIVLN